MSTAITSYERIERPGSVWFRDFDGVMATCKHRDEIMQITLNVSDALATGETVSSASWSDSGVTTSSRSTSSTAVVANVTGTDGSTEVSITTSTGRKIVLKRRFYGVADGGDRRDYP